jgi:hypothetical protein
LKRAISEKCLFFASDVGDGTDLLSSSLVSFQQKCWKAGHKCRFSRERNQKMKTFRSRLSVEMLEKREMLAGDVRVQASGGDLYVTGDNAANHVQLIAVSQTELRVRGIVLYNQTTRLNGGTLELSIRGTLRNVFVNMGGGDDQLDLGTGNQIPIKATNDIWIDMGSGSDWVTVRDARAGHDIIVNTGAGARDVANVLGSVATNEIVVGDPSNIGVSASDRNEVQINSSSAKKVSTVFGNGQDHVDIVASAADSIYASLGAGNDSFKMTFTKPRKSYTFDGGSGYDSFFAPMNQGVRFTPSNFERVNNA